MRTRKAMKTVNQLEEDKQRWDNAIKNKQKGGFKLMRSGVLANILLPYALRIEELEDLVLVLLKELEHEGVSYDYWNKPDKQLKMLKELIEKEQNQ